MIVRKKVLIVDDDISTRLLVRKVLKKLDHVDFLEAENGKEAIQIVNEKEPDLILMDVIMPGIDGYETCRRIKNNPMNLKPIIVIFLTAVNMDDIEDKITSVRGDDLLRKPLDACELYFRVKNYLSLAFSKDEAMICKNGSLKGDFGNSDEEEKIDLGKGIYYQPAQKRLSRDNMDIPLMKQEILLLEALIASKNRIISYDELLKTVSKEGESSIENLRTLIKLLRRKTYKELIYNLNSYGYRLQL